MKLLLISCLMLLPLLMEAQDKLVKYYDANWSPCPQEKSMYYAEFVKDGDRYNCNFYWTSTNMLGGKAMYLDTSLSKPIGWQIGYSKNGSLEDSNFYDNSGKLINSYHYYANKQLEVHYYIPDNQQSYATEAFDQAGKKIKDYVYSKEAEFKGGEKAWQSYLVKNVSKDFRAKDDKDITVSLKVMFVVNENGYPTNAKVIESSGLGYVDKDAVRVILASPQWNPSVYLNKPVKAYRIQPFTYQLVSAKKK